MKRRGSASWRPTWGRVVGASPGSRSFIAAPDHARQAIAEQRKLLARRVKTLPQRPDASINGRGIVMAVGGRFIASAWVALSILRQHHRCDLPVEIWYLNDADLPPRVRQLFEPFGVDFRDASRVEQALPGPPLSGWSLKPFAILHSRFAEVLLLDADNVPLVDPAALFDLPEYRRSGALFWPDVRMVNPDNPIWSICDLDPPAGPEWESGQVLVDKTRCWPALQLTMHFNQRSDFYYRYVYGDKETFHLAWHRLDAPFAMPRRVPQFVKTTSEADGRPTLLGLLQHDLAGEPLFFHRNGFEWVAWGHNPRAPGFALHDDCLTALDRLRQLWDGYLTPPPEAAAGAAFPVQDGTPRPFSYIRRGLESRRITLNADGRVGRGAREAECYWRLEEDEGGRSLILSSRESDTCRLRLEHDGVWRGVWLRDEHTPVELIPLRSDDHGRDAGRQDALPRLLYISPVTPADRGNGLAMRAAHVLAHLTRRYRVSLLIVPLYPSGPGGELPPELRARCDDVRSVPPPQRFDRASDDPARQAQLTAAWAAEAGRAYPATEFDVVHLFRLATLPFAEPYLSRVPDRAVAWQIDLDDVESRTEQRLAALYQRHGMLSEQAEAERRATTASGLEARLLRTWDRVYVCSEQDRAELAARAAGGRADMVVLPNVVRLPANPTPARRNTPLTILYLGTFGYFPNSDAAVWFCRDILPVVREQTPVPVRVVLVGSGAPPEVWDLGHIPEVTVTGAVPDVAPWYDAADLVVAPLRAGGGTRIKILEALSYRRPVVSTSLGAEGLNLVDGAHLLLADRPHHFAQQCLRLVNDPALAARLADAGRARVAERYALPQATTDVRATREPAIEPAHR